MIRSWLESLQLASMNDWPDWGDLSGWLEPFITHHGAYLPILLLFLEEAGVPLPLPGDAVMLYLGYQIHQGVISYWMAYVLLMAAILGGSSLLYYVSFRYGQTLVLRLGKYLHLNEHKLVQIEDKFRRYGPLVIIFGRHIPGFRIPITVFAGISSVRYHTFLWSTFVSVAFWIPIYLALGARLGPRTVNLLHGHSWFGVLFALPLVALVGWIIYVRMTTKGAAEIKVTEQKHTL
jgi:membrane protein DedA with SNARE-associated domain